MVLHYAIREGQTIQDYDVMNLYPYVCKYATFPIGHTKFHVGDACHDKQAMLGMEGQIKCTGPPPKRQNHPVLPLLCNNKLLFCLCRMCAVKCNFSGESVHESTAQMSLTSTCALEEIRLAIQKGYQVLDIMEVYEYVVTK